MSYKVIDAMDFSLAIKQNMGSDILDPLSRIIYFSMGYTFKDSN